MTGPRIVLIGAASASFGLPTLSSLFAEKDVLDGATISLVVIICVIALDAVGIGLIFPILPSLLKELTGNDEISTTYGFILAAYAAMQFLFSPILGLFSDPWGAPAPGPHGPAGPLHPIA